MTIPTARIPSAQRRAIPVARETLRDGHPLEAAHVGPGPPGRKNASAKSVWASLHGSGVLANYRLGAGALLIISSSLGDYGTGGSRPRSRSIHTDLANVDCGSNLYVVRQIALRSQAGDSPRGAGAIHRLGIYLNNHFGHVRHRRNRKHPAEGFSTLHASPHKLPLRGRSACIFRGHDPNIPQVLASSRGKQFDPRGMDNMRRWQHNCRVHVTAAFQVTPCSLGAVCRLAAG